MDNNTRSYISRFSGLLLFLLTLLVVGVLVILTVRAARDSDDSTGVIDGSTVAIADGEATVEGTDFIIDGDTSATIVVDGDSANIDTPDVTVGVVTTDDEDQSTDGFSDVAGVSDTAENGSSESSDSDSDSDDSDTPTIVAVTGGDELPNTGAGANMLGLILVGAMLYAFLGSRRDMIRAAFSK